MRETLGLLDGGYSDTGLYRVCSAVLSLVYGGWVMEKFKRFRPLSDEIKNRPGLSMVATPLPGTGPIQAVTVLCGRVIAIRDDITYMANGDSWDMIGPYDCRCGGSATITNDILICDKCGIRASITVTADEVNKWQMTEC